MSAEGRCKKKQLLFQISDQFLNKQISHIWALILKAVRLHIRVKKHDTDSKLDRLGSLKQQQILMRQMIREALALIKASSPSLHFTTRETRKCKETKRWTGKAEGRCKVKWSNPFELNCSEDDRDVFIWSGDGNISFFSFFLAGHEMKWDDPITSAATQ